MGKSKGTMLERFITVSNKQYALKGIAQVDKIPTPTIPIRRGGRITGMKYIEKSTVDFVGIAQGKFIAFEAKETEIPRFEFRRLEVHQEAYLERIQDMGGYGFILIYFKKEQEFYLLTIGEYHFLSDTLNRKSVPLSWFRDHREPVVSRNGIAFDYLGALWNIAAEDG